MRLSLLTGVGALALFASACSSNSSGASPDAAMRYDAGAPTDARTQDVGVDGAAADAEAASDAAPEAAAACNTLTNAASVVTVKQVAQDPPSAQGGTVVDGTYFLTDATIYTGANGPSGDTGTTQTTIAISGTTIESVTTGQPPTRTVTLATSGTTFTSKDTCPDDESAAGSYTAAATTFAILLPAGEDDAGARTLVETFTLQ